MHVEEFNERFVKVKVDETKTLIFNKIKNPKNL